MWDLDPPAPPRPRQIPPNSAHGEHQPCRLHCGGRRGHYWVLWERSCMRLPEFPCAFSHLWYMVAQLWKPHLCVFKMPRIFMGHSNLLNRQKQPKTILNPLQQPPPPPLPPIRIPATLPLHAAGVGQHPPTPHELGGGVAGVCAHPFSFCGSLWICGPAIRAGMACESGTRTCARLNAVWSGISFPTIRWRRHGLFAYKPPCALLHLGEWHWGVTQ